MKGRKRLELAVPDASFLDPTTWAEIDEEGLKPLARELYRRRRRAVIGYLAGVPTPEITANTQISRPEIYRLSRRCLAAGPDGMPLGFQALIPRKRIVSFTRSDNLTPHSQGAGLLGALFEHYPAIPEAIRLEYLGKGRMRKLGLRPTLKAMHKYFLDLCRDQGIPPDQYPFGYRKQGKEALRQYLLGLADAEPARVAEERGAKDAGRRWRVGDPADARERLLRPFAEVQVDGHKIDLRCVIDVPGIDGLPVRLPLSRFWILALIDSASRAILGYHICLSREYGAHDVLQTLKNSLTPWQPMALGIPGLEYHPGAGFPSGVIPELRHVPFDMILLDNAMAHRAHRVRDAVLDVFGGTVNWGPAGTPEVRGIVERFFQRITAVAHRLPSTTGSHPRDPRRTDPEKRAVELNVQLADIEQLLEVIVANYNGTMHKGTGRVPLEHLRLYAQQGHQLIRMLPAQFAETPPLFKLRLERRVRGDLKQGRRPYIEFSGVRYTSVALSGMSRLIGKPLTLHINTDDLRHVDAFFPDGSPAGSLRAQGAWALTRHSLWMRKAIHAARDAGEFSFGSGQDPVEAYLRHIRSKATRKSSSAANDYMRAVRDVRPSNLPKPATEQSPPAPEQTQGADWKPRRKNWIKIT